MDDLGIDRLEHGFDGDEHNNFYELVRIRDGQSKNAECRDISNPDIPALPHQQTLYACEYCSFVNNRKHDLKLHVMVVHDLRLREHLCPECGESYARKDDLTHHQQQYHTNMGSPRRNHSEGKSATASKSS
ncbi:hypothetical protein C8T65DRAFT_672371 [Cerioporus squamosus]|nr:hypothetical protein C8T65DRAFT_672371 [Cerioporus squamosus]